MLHTVVLRHTLADGSWHFDWLLEDPTRAGDRRLRTFRVVPADPTRPAMVHLPQADLFHGVEIDHHRDRYLTYEGDIGEGRGRVDRVASGSYEIVRATPNALVFDVRFGAESVRWLGIGTAKGDWRFGRSPRGVTLSDGDGIW